MERETKLVVFLFRIDRDNRIPYACALQIAQFLKATLVLFTSVPERTGHSGLDKIYLHLLELEGFYQTYYNQWKKNIVSVEKVIRKGDILTQFVRFLEDHKVDYLVFNRNGNPVTRGLNSSIEDLKKVKVPFTGK